MVGNSPRTVQEAVKFLTKVMLWGMFSVKGTGRLHICEGTMNAAKYIYVLAAKMELHLRNGFQSKTARSCWMGHHAILRKCYLCDSYITLLD